jgi:hypothetical protein
MFTFSSRCPISAQRATSQSRRLQLACNASHKQRFGNEVVPSMNASAYRDLKFRTAGRLRPTVRTFFAHVIPAMRRFGLQQPSLVKCLKSQLIGKFLNGRPRRPGKLPRSPFCGNTVPSAVTPAVYLSSEEGLDSDCRHCATSDAFFVHRRPNGKTTTDN